jgi:hypothetical protein
MPAQTSVWPCLVGKPRTIPAVSYARLTTVNYVSLKISEEKAACREATIHRHPHCLVDSASGINERAAAPDRQKAGISGVVPSPHGLGRRVQSTNLIEATQT